MSKHCPMCAGPGALLGSLGRTKHFRCVDCGWTFSRTPKARARRPVAAALAAVAIALTGCGGSTSDELDCRPDIMGPPAPSVAHLPTCENPNG
jgi:hypothetical protein